MIRKVGILSGLSCRRKPSGRFELTSGAGHWKDFVGDPERATVPPRSLLLDITVELDAGECPRSFDLGTCLVRVNGGALRIAGDVCHVLADDEITDAGRIAGSATITIRDSDT